MAGADVDVGTELRLGLPGGGAEAAKAGKRGFEDTIDLKLKLPTAGKPEPAGAAATDPEKPPATKAQAVGWPPVRSYRRNIMTVQSVKNKKEEEADKQQPAANAGGNSSAFVKVSMDGAPYLRKVDLAAHGGYAALLRALHDMFAPCLAIRGAGANGEGNKLVDSATGAEYVPTYEDKDGDWMLVGDVPWKMFVESCKRIRLMKSSEAVNLSPRPSSQ